MALDLEQIKKRLTQLKQTTQRQNNLWKPSPGTSQIRIVPYKHNKDNPFIELYFHYDVNGRTYLSPVSFGRPDPFVEFAEKLKSTGSQDDYRLARKLEPNMRIFLPVVVRGSEGEGVKFWGFGKTVYQELLGFIADPDYGDITDPVSGRDVAVEFKSAEELGRSFPMTTIRVKPNQTTLTDDKSQLENMFNNQKNITDIYKELSYDELRDVLEKWMNPEGQEEIQASDVPASTPQTQTTAASTESPQKVEEISKAFDKLFNE